MAFPDIPGGICRSVNAPWQSSSERWRTVLFPHRFEIGVARMNLPRRAGLRFVQEEDGQHDDLQWTLLSV